MNPQILTLFGEEFAPEQVKTGEKARAKEKKQKKERVVEEVELPEGVAEDNNSVILGNWQPEKQYYAIGEVAALFEVNTSHIRFWTKEFALKVRTTKKGDRLFTPAQIYQLRNIYHLVKEKGYTLSGAKAKLREGKKTAADSVSLRQSLLKLRNQLVTIRDQVL